VAAQFNIQSIGTLKMEKTTFYRFLSEIKAFLRKLCEDPINAKPSAYLLERNFNRTKCINVLMKADILERKETVKDHTDSEEISEPTYNLSFKVKKTDFERKIKKLFIKYFEKNLNECEGGCGGEGGAIGGDAGIGGDVAVDGATTTQINMGHPDVPFGGIIDREYFPVVGKGQKEKKKGDNTKPENILGKEITAESCKTPRKIYISEEQYNMLMEDGSPSTCTVGALGDYTAGGLVLKTSYGKEDPCAKAGKIKVKTFK